MSEQQTEQSAPPAEKKWEIDYQPTDEQGNPIGRKTHLGPFDTPEELIEAQRTQNVEAVRAYFRVKNAKIDPIEARPDFKQQDWDADTQFKNAHEAYKPETFRKAVRENIEAELGAPIPVVRQALQDAYSINAKLTADEWGRQHANDYYPCAENKAAMIAWIEENNAEITANNLDIALESLTLQGKLIPVPVKNAISDPVVETQQREEIPPPNPQPRRQPASGIMPGQFSGTRQTTRRPGLTKEDIRKMDKHELKRRMAIPALREELERVANSK